MIVGFSGVVRSGNVFFGCFRATSQHLRGYDQPLTPRHAHTGEAEGKTRSRGGCADGAAVRPHRGCGSHHSRICRLRARFACGVGAYICLVRTIAETRLAHTRTRVMAAHGVGSHGDAWERQEVHFPRDVAPSADGATGDAMHRAVSQVLSCADRCSRMVCEAVF